MLFTLIIAAQMLFGWLLYDSRIRAQLAAEQAGASVVELLAAALQQEFDSFNRSLDGVLIALALPGIWDVAPQIRRHALFDASIQSKEISGMLVTDRTGKLLAHSTGSVRARTSLIETISSFMKLISIFSRMLAVH